MKNKLVDSRQSTVGRLWMAIPNKLVRLTYLLAVLFVLPVSLLAQADSTQPHAVDMATTMRSNGKIYVVVAVLTIILVSLFLYLIRLDRKIGKLEKE